MVFATEPFSFQIEPMAARDLAVGVIADTHGYFDPAVPRLFKGCGMIVHLGDIGSPEILAELERIAPVVAIRGNHEPQALMHLPTLRLVELGGVRTLLSHGLSSMEREVARAVFPQFYERFRAERIRLVLFGHTHDAEVYEEDGVVFANPGFAGPPEHGRARSVATLRLAAVEGIFEFLPLKP